MRAGASDFLVRPVAPERLLEALAANADRRRAAGELAPVSEKLAPPLALEQLIGAAPEFRTALAIAAKSARTRLPVLIIGEPGTGKETVARAIHAASLRAKGPLLSLDCKAIPDNIVDSELFGHEKGAFPGAFSARTGKLVQADGGTLVLDEISALPAETQENLDRMLATGEVRPVGLNGSQSVDVRVIATSSRPLPEDFHPGLAERIGAATVTLPPLRDRSSDIPALARHLLNRLSEQTGLRALSIGNDALAVLMRYGWPGNVRQLAGVLFRAGLQADGSSLTAEHFPHIAIQSRFSGRRTDFVPTLSQSKSDEAIAGAPGVSLYTADGHLRPLDEVEADIIRLAIGHYRGRMTEVARRLGIGRSTLYRKLGDLGIDTAA
jgi:DNA-binding NtrC family response regulator